MGSEITIVSGNAAIRRTRRFLGTSILILLVIPAWGADVVAPDPTSDITMVTPQLSPGPPRAGNRVRVTPPEYAGTEVFHTIYLPEDWTGEGPKLPIIFEYTGNYFPQSGSSGEVEDAGLGFGLSAGRFIWVSLPYISEDGSDNQIRWWGDLDATVNYAKQNVPKIIHDFNADPNNVFLCGFSRGAIGVNFIGMHDDEIAKLWTAMVSHDHFDGVKAWGGTRWGSPLEAYREKAKARLSRVGDRPYLVSQNGPSDQNEAFIRSTLQSARGDAGNFIFSHVKTSDALGDFPNDLAKSAHTDRWLVKPSVHRVKTWQWIRDVVARRQSAVQLGELVFEDQFSRNESQESKDEPGNEWTTSSDKTAGGNKQVDLRDGTMHIFTHATANHATSVRQTYEFRDGTIAIRFKLPSETDSLKMNFTDLGCKTVHAGHLFDVILAPKRVTIQDRKTGEMNLKIREARVSGALSQSQRDMLATKKKFISVDLPAGIWHEVYAHVDQDRVAVELNGKLIGSFNSEGFAHPTKTMIRLLVPDQATVDDVRIWRRK